MVHMADADTFNRGWVIPGNNLEMGTFPHAMPLFYNGSIMMIACSCDGCYDKQLRPRSPRLECTLEESQDAHLSEGGIQ